MRIAFAGTPQVAATVLDELVESHHEVVGVITRPDAPTGRGKKLQPSVVAARAEELGLPVLKPAHPREQDFQDALRGWDVEAVAVVAYGALLPQSALDLVPQGWINLHFSLLPRWRGAAPVQRAILAGDLKTGATTFRIVKALDAGPIHRSITMMISSTATSGQLLDELAHAGGPLMVQTFDDIAAGIEPVEQGDEGVTLAAKISTDDAHIDWTQDAATVSRQIRAVTPVPGAWGMLGDEVFKIEQVAASSDPRRAPHLAPGQLTADKRTLWVGTGTSPLELVRVKAAGKRAMEGAAWARGVHLTDASVLN
ncbi:methionyl-tRNA formyltransferase [Propionibacteriaceae bacterium G1746]|uniref:methionyl-tRNA formyltransferase n=1 Tax=Aestuariimicrobium sp. G57 TaxID=3418485 RepID=UPI003C1E6AE8